MINCAAMTGKYLLTTKAALEVGAHYMDVGSFEEEDTQLALTDEFGKKGLVGALGMGFTPGLVNIAAAYAIERLDRTDSVDIRWSIVDIVPPSEHSRELYGGFGWWGYIYNYHSLPSTRWENGQRIEFPPRHGQETFAFKGPIGDTVVAGWPGYDSDYLSKSFPEIPNIESKAAVGIETGKKWQFLKGLGFNKTEPIDVRGQMVSPWAVLETLLNSQPPETKKPPDIRHGGAIIVKGVKNQKKTEYRIDLWPSESLVKEYKDLGCVKYGGAGGVFRVGTPMGTAAVLIARGQTKGKGVFYPELAFPAKEFLEQEASSGLNVEITKTEVL
jgi:saccharopine dehydrogenase (NAD+, L-lysine-forming)